MKMAGSHTLLILIGNLGRDPEMRYLSSGDPLTAFSVATIDRHRGPDGQQHDQTTWFRVSAFGKLAETCRQYLRKGSYVYLAGSLWQREWIGHDGTKPTTLEVRAREMRMLDRRGDGGEVDPGRSAVGEPSARDASADDGELDDVPF
jgi:single-strand DNA-binding protein